VTISVTEINHRDEKKATARFILFCLVVIFLLFPTADASPQTGVLFRIEKETSLLKSMSSSTADARLQALRAELASTVKGDITYALPIQLHDTFTSGGDTDDYLRRWFKVQATDSTAAQRVLAALESNPLVDTAEINRAFHLDFVPNDPLLDQQWALEKIRAYAAWDVERGSHEIPVAIIDTGIDYRHYDLRNNIWINPGEDANSNGLFDESDVNGIDDDANGFVDDIQGWDFTDAPNYPDGGDYLSRDNDPMDESGHGTGVAGIIGAVANNGQGIAGIAYNCLLMNVRAFTANGFGEEDDVASAILYAVANGARVINMSWGDVFVSRLIDDVIRFAEGKNVVMIASSGNSATDQIHYPSAFAGTISVGATDENDDLAGFSNYGPTLDLVAPGVNIYSTTLDNSFSTFNGTSFSAPFVSGAAALLLSRDNSLSPEAVRGLLTRSADDLGNSGWDRFFGSGRLDVGKAVELPLYSLAKIASPKTDQGFSGDRIDIYGSAWSPTLENYTLDYSRGEDPEEWQTIDVKYDTRVIESLLGTWRGLPQEDGSYTMRLVINNRDGTQAEHAVRIFLDKTPPNIKQIDLLPMVDGPFYTTLVQIFTDDLCEGSVFYRSQFSNASFRELAMPFRTTELRLNIGPQISAETVEVKFAVKNGAGLITEDDNAGRLYPIALDQPPINSTDFTFLAATAPYGHLLGKAVDMNGNGLPELAINTRDENGSGTLELYELENGDMKKVFSFEKSLFPRDVAETERKGIYEMLCGFGYSSYLYQSPAPGQFPGDLMLALEGDGSTQYWASRIADLDGDHKDELIIRVVTTVGDTVSDRFEVWEQSIDNQFTSIAVLDNPTGGSNQNGVPHCEIGDFDGDGLTEILLGDSDGDIYIYENTGDNSYTATWQDSLPLEDSIDYLSVGDYDGDGRLEFIAGCHSNPNLNTEHFYDARHWTYRIYDNDKDNSYVPVKEWRFFGFESPKDFASGVSSGDVDGDGDDEILICVFPDFYVIDYANGDFAPVYYGANIQTNSAVVTDMDNNGQKEVWIGDGTAIRGLIRVGEVTAPAAPPGLAATPLGPDKVRITWYGVEGADEYQLYRSTGNDPLSLYLETSENSTIDTDVRAGVIYCYAMKTIDSSKSPVMSQFSQTVTAKPGANPKVVQAQMETNESVRVTFSKRMSESIKIISNYEISNGIGRPTSIAYDRSGQEAILSLPIIFQQGMYTVTCRNLHNVDGVPLDTTANSATFESRPELSAPYLVRGELVSSSQIELVFNEPMERESVEDEANYDLGSFLTLRQATQKSGDPSVVVLDIGPGQIVGALGKAYTIRVKDVRNAQGIAIVKGRGDLIQLIFARQSLSDVFTYPNPYQPQTGEGKITFANLTRKAEIYIMTSEGRFVRKLVEADGDGGVDWDLKDESGRDVAAGIYIYKAVSSTDSKLGKLAILR
jgi:subtilisin family serine protease